METTEILHAMTEPTRFRLLTLLFEHHYCVKALAKKLDISEPAVSQHMRVLKKYGIVYGVKLGYQTHYQVSKEKIVFLLNDLTERLSHCPPNTEMPSNRECCCEFISECNKRN